MNIFLLSDQYCPIESAQMQCDAHIRKQGIETCQLLATAFPLERLKEKDCPRTQTGNPRKHFNPNHPCGIWARKSAANFDWLIIHGLELFAQFNKRYKKRHFTELFLDWVVSHVDEAEVPEGDLTDFPVAINEKTNCRQIDGFEELSVYEKYRAFYLMDKPFAKWEKGIKVPEWYAKSK